MSVIDEIRDLSEAEFTENDNSLPLCSHECRHYDGKRCRQTGFRPDMFCEPALIQAMRLLHRRTK